MVISRPLSILLLIVPFSLAAVEDKLEDTFDSYTIEELEESHKQAQLPVLNLIKRLSHPGIINKKQNRITAFVGEPGTGKSTSAAMVAYKVCDMWPHEIVSCPKFTRSGRNKTSETLKEYMEGFEGNDDKPTKKVLFIFDESNDLLDHADDPHYDTDSNGRYLTSWINEHRVDPSKYMILTANHMTSFPEQIIDRIEGIGEIRFEGIKSVVGRRKNLLYQLRSMDYELAKGIADADIDKLVEPCNGWTGRSFENVARTAFDEYQNTSDDFDHVVLTIEHLKKGFQRVYSTKQRYSKRAEKDYDQRERHHEDAMYQANVGNGMNGVGLAMNGVGLGMRLFGL